MAKWWTVTLVAILAILGSLFWFVHRPQRAELELARTEAAKNAGELVAARAENARLESRVADLESLAEETRQASEEARRTSQSLEAAKAELEARLAAKEAELARLAQTRQDLETQLQEEIRKGEIKLRRIQDKLRVDLVDRILFDSGEAEIKESGQEVLRRVGGVLRDVTDRIIEVQGHTDNVQIVGRLAERYATNWELSAARAVNVTRFLQEEVGLDPTKLSAVAFSEYRPKASNDTEEGKQENRRIEILLSPLIKVPGEP